MSNSTPHTIRLQDGSLCNLRICITQSAPTLLSTLETIPDPRSKQGRRHSAALMLFMVFVGLLRGSKDLKDVQLFATLNQPFFCKQVGFALPHGIPDPTTIARLLERINPDDLIRIYLKFLQTLGMSPSDVLSYDGKTMRAVSGEAATRHILSFFSHDTIWPLAKSVPPAKVGRSLLLSSCSNRAKPVSISSPVSCCLVTHSTPRKLPSKQSLKARADYLFVVER